VIEVRLRPLAEAGLVERTRYYRFVGGDELGGRFFDMAIEGLSTLGRMPSVGSVRIGELCDVAGLGSTLISGFPCGWFYSERVDHVDVVRLVAHAQDLATVLGDLAEDVSAIERGSCGDFGSRRGGALRMVCCWSRQDVARCRGG